MNPSNFVRNWCYASGGNFAFLFVQYFFTRNSNIFFTSLIASSIALIFILGFGVCVTAFKQYKSAKNYFYTGDYWKNFFSITQYDQDDLITATMASLVVVKQAEISHNKYKEQETLLRLEAAQEFRRKLIAMELSFKNQNDFVFKELKQQARELSCILYRRTI